jgi:CheY-like chemotaxis protein
MALEPIGWPAYDFKSKVAKILVIDDDEVLREYAAECLRGVGHEVLTAEDGETGVALAAAERPDVVVTDVMMPGMFGFAVVHVLRENPTLAKTRIIISSLNFHADPEGVRSSGADRFLPKPYAPEALVGMVSELLGS